MAVTLLSSPWLFTGPFKTPVKLREDTYVIRDTPDWAYQKLKQALFLLSKIVELLLPQTAQRKGIAGKAGACSNSLTFANMSLLRIILTINGLTAIAD